MKKGFTLIELLIVVAIIAILAAIAIPNFLQAQIRARVSRVNNDLRTLATALESYYVDHNEYPPHAFTAANNWWYFIGHNNITAEGRSPEWFQPLNFLTSPISYITGIGPDPFAPTPQDAMYNYPYRYVSTFVVDEGGDEPWAFLRPVVGGWLTWSAGPELSGAPMYWTVEGVYPLEDFNNQIYDPTNGITSRGDIYRSQIRSDGGPAPVPGS